MKDSVLPIPKGKTEGLKESLKATKPVIQPTTLKQRLEEEHLSVSSKKQRLSAKPSPKRSKNQTARGERVTKPAKQRNLLLNREGEKRILPWSQSNGSNLLDSKGKENCKKWIGKITLTLTLTSYL